MGKAIDLDRFKTETKVLLDGTEYTIRQMAVKDMVKSDMDEQIKNAETDKDKLDIMMEFAEKVSDIPKSVMESMTFDQFNTLIAACQGRPVKDE